MYEWRRYLAAVIALAVAAVLVLSMTGMFMGVSKSFTATVDRSPGDVIILAPHAESLFSNNSGQPRRIIPTIYGNASVVEVQALNFNFAFWSNFPKEGQVAKAEGVQIIIIDPVPGAVTLPKDFGDELVQALQEPYSVVIDQSSLNKLGVQLVLWLSRLHLFLPTSQPRHWIQSTGKSSLNYSIRPPTSAVPRLWW